MEYKNLNFVCCETNDKKTYKCIVTGLRNKIHFEFYFNEDTIYNDYIAAEEFNDITYHIDSFEYLLKSFENNLARFLEDIR